MKFLIRPNTNKTNNSCGNACGSQCNADCRSLGSCFCPLK